MEEQKVPAAVSARVEAALDVMQGVSARLRKERDEVLLALARVIALQVRSENLLSRLTLRQGQARERQLKLEEVAHLATRTVRAPGKWACLMNW